MTLHPFLNGPFHNQTLPVDLIDTPRGQVAPELVRLSWLNTTLGPVPKFVEEGGEVYRLVDGEYVWEG